jgi:uncharacterized repeat protein (TIGR01451 family)
MTSQSKRIAYCAGTAIALLMSQQALAAGTLAGTGVNNTASVAYSVGGVPQSAVNSNTATFLVDRRINLAVAELGGAATVVAPGAQNQVTTFTVTNSTNFTQDFRLLATQDANAATTAFADTDSFDGASVRIFVDNLTSGTVGSYDAADTAVYIDELAPDSTRTVFVVVNVPAGLIDQSTAGVSLTAVAAEAGTANTMGSDSTQTAGVDNPRDGKSSDDDEYDVSAATITLVKSSRVLSDPFNGTTNPKAIPEAEVEYCIQVANTGSAAATGVALSDPLPAQTTYKVNTLRAGGTVTGGACNSDGSTEDDDASGADETDPVGASFAGTTVSSTLASVAAGATTTVRFTVKVN